ncbi:hypothetical protein BpHYR1_053249 [Brachionus plicatilis]|uniref:Uncharacterized protein n=1 Tax=Brachionus plicatilis TaxID=10195 RepID=A0A3M7SZV7_BRAPC|nr:hypothetical protein BpHYR1_053249 [Brachionus plicatilis]
MSKIETFLKMMIPKNLLRIKPSDSLIEQRVKIDIYRIESTERFFKLFGNFDQIVADIGR